MFLQEQEDLEKQFHLILQNQWFVDFMQWILDNVILPGFLKKKLSQSLCDAKGQLQEPSDRQVKRSEFKHLDDKHELCQRDFSGKITCFYYVSHNYSFDSTYWHVGFHGCVVFIGLSPLGGGP